MDMYSISANINGYQYDSTFTHVFPALKCIDASITQKLCTNNPTFLLCFKLYQISGFLFSVEILVKKKNVMGIKCGIFSLVSWHYSQDELQKLFWCNAYADADI